MDPQMDVRRAPAGLYWVASLLTAAFLALPTLARGIETAGASADRIDRWIADLQSHDLTRRWQAVYALGQTGPAAAGAVEPLAAILANLAEHEYVRGATAWALGRIGPQAELGVPVLIDTLGSAHISVRRNSPLALAAIGSPEAIASVPRLLDLLEDPDREVRVNAAVALWRLARHEHSIPVLQAMLAGPGVGAYEAAVALGRLDGAPEQQVLGPLVDAFAHDDATVRRAAARSVGKLGGVALPALQTAFKHAQDKVRQAAAESLGWMGPQAVPDLIAALRNDSPAVRRIAARSLGRLGAEASEAKPDLLAALDDPHPEVRQAAAWAIGRVRREP